MTYRRCPRPALQGLDASLLREVEGFLELHSGPRAGLSTVGGPTWHARAGVERRSCWI